LLLTPPTPESKPCACAAPSCANSHGLEVDIGHLLPIAVLDVARLRVDARALAAFDGLWYPCSVVDVDGRGGFSVVFDGFEGERTWVGPEEIVPLVGLEDEEDVEERGGGRDEDTSTEEGEDDGESEEENGSVSCGIGALGTPSAGSDGTPFGDWEAHTKGIGSRLMLKMGYRMGSGLGRHAEGIVRPVEVRILSSGKGLGHSGMKRKRTSTPHSGSGASTPGRKRGKTGSDAGSISSASASTVFDFLNGSLNARHRPVPSPSSSHAPTPVREPSALPKPGTSTATANAKATNLKLCRAQDNIAALRKELAKLRESHQRNERRDPKVAAALKIRIDEVTTAIESLQRREKALEAARDADKSKKKMLVF
ncbi:hypothetical protein BDK51DRAFT_44021, partial [Blyttiomyces helicus]